MDFLHFLENIRTDFGTTFFSFVYLLGEEVVMIAIICLIYWCIDKQFGYRMSFAYFLSGLFVQVLKLTVRIDRPWVLDQTLQPVPSALETATGYSFPSGHTQSATAMFASFAFRVKNKIGKILLFIPILLVALSRMYVGVHTPKDVIVSFIVSILLVIIANYIFMKRSSIVAGSKKQGSGIYIFVLMASLVAAVYMFILSRNNEIPTEYILDGAKAAGAGIGFAIGWWVEERYIRFYEGGLSVPAQALKYIIGLAIAVLLKEGLKVMLGAGILSDMVRYMLLVLWVTVGYPLLIKQVINKRQKVNK